MSKESPLGSTEKGVGFDVGGAGSGADATVFFFDEEFANEGFAETGDTS